MTHTFMDEYKQIQELAKTNPVVHQVLQMFYFNQCSWEEAMMVAVIQLVEQNEVLKQSIIERMSTQTMPNFLRPK